ncbi:Ail/Lom family outer membrane beta-barrel protein [Salmonella enterica]|nr:Ail/Lom family outer membrane beta-barrel protein [Salmonella enterica]
MKKLVVMTTVISALFFGMGVANAAAGQSTISIGYAQFHSNGLKNAINSDKRDAYDLFDSDAYHIGDYKDPKGFNIKYRYEFSDQWGIISSFSYAKAKSNSSINAIDPDSSDVVKGKGNSKVDYYNIMVGPAYRVNDYVSGYAMLGIATSNIKSSGNLFYDLSYTTGTTGSYSGTENDRDTALSYSIGFQVNPISNIAIDVAYEGAGHGSNGQVSGFNVGIGYSF